MKELSLRARDLITSVGDGDGPAPGDRERVRRALVAALAATGTTLASSAGVAAMQGGVAVGGGGAAGGGAAVVSSKLIATAALWMLGGGVMGFAVGVPIAIRNADPVSVVSISAVRAKPAEKSTPAQSRLPAATPRSEPDLKPAEPIPASRFELPVPERGSLRSPSRGAAEFVGTPSVAGEVALLKDAQLALAAGDGTAALALLEQHAKRFPGGALVAERMAARVFALCELGRQEQARSAAQAFLRVAPDSPLVPRVMASCGLAGTGL